jgi:hypothetical protein
MKVLALFQIYLPYFLPRTPDWSAAPFFQHFFDIEGQRVNVHPRKADEQLFPNPIDKELAKLEVPIHSDFIVPSDAPRAIALRDRCFDRIEAQVLGEVVNKDLCRQPEVTFAYRRSAISACNKFLYHCRVVGRDAEIGGLSWHYSFDHDRCYFSYPHTLIWFDAETKEILTDIGGKPFWTAQSGSLRSPARVPIDFSVVNASLSANQEPKLYTALLVSAKEKLMLDQRHEGVVGLASACEVASTQFIQRKGLSSDPVVTQLLREHKSFAKKRYDDITHFAVGRSLKAENPAVFTLLENAYKTRNSAVHDGQLKYYDSTLSQEVLVTRSMANAFFRACETAIDWIDAL